MDGNIFLCDIVRVTDNGSRFDAIGAGISLIQATQFPTTVNFAALIDMRFSLADSEKEHFFELRIIDSDGKHAALPIVGNVKISKEHRRSLYPAFNIQMLIKKPVFITFSLIINGEEKDNTTVQFVQIQPDITQQTTKQSNL